MPMPLSMVNLSVALYVVRKAVPTRWLEWALAVVVLLMANRPKVTATWKRGIRPRAAT